MKSLIHKKEDLSLLKMRALDLSDEIDMMIKILRKIQMDIQLLRKDIIRDESIS